MKLDQKLEKELKLIVVEHLGKGRPGWDIPHTLASVYWMIKLIKTEEGNEKILVTVMYLHDIGYFKFNEKCTFDDVMAAKEEHMKVGAKESEKILKELSRYSSSEIKQIVHLVRVHDSLDLLSTNDEILVVEADSLAQIDFKRALTTFDKQNHLKHLDCFKKERVPLFKTKTGKKYLKELLKKAEHYFD